MNKGINILLVEDNPDDVELTLHALKKNKIANPVKIVRDGQEALDYLYHKGKYESMAYDLPNVILLDLKLPKVDGIEVLQRIKSDRRTKLIPVVVLTSSKEESDLLRSYDLGVNSYIRKPVDFDQFVETVRQIGFYWMLINEQPQVK
jgi:two-component system, response regulator